MAPVRFDVPPRPATFDRGQVVLRLVLLILLGVIGAPLGWVFGVLYVGLPVIAAAFVSSGGAARWRDDAGLQVLGALRWLLGIFAYLALLFDRPPTREGELGIDYEVDRSGTPTVGDTLLKLLTSLPAAIVLWLLSFVGGILWLVGAIAILATGSLPASIWEFQRGLVRMYARFFAHHASLVEGAAPVRFDTGPEAPVAPTPATSTP